MCKLMIADIILEMYLPSRLHMRQQFCGKKAFVKLAVCKFISLCDRVSHRKD